MRVFLSYSWSDSQFAEQLLSRLVAEKLDVWDPARELYPGSNWFLETGRALERADCVVFLISKNSAQSPALRREVEYAVTNRRFKDRVVPIMLSRGVKNVPWILQKMSVIDAADHDMDRVAKLVAAAMRRSQAKVRSVARRSFETTRGSKTAKQVAAARGSTARTSTARKLVGKPVENNVPTLDARELRALLASPKNQIGALSALRDRSAGDRNRYFCAVRDNAILELLFSTGIHIGELVAINVSYVSVEENQTYITGATRGRTLTITSQAVIEALVNYLDMRADRNLTTEALFIGRSGTRLTIYSIENIFKKHVRLAGIKRHITPHSLRLTMAAMLVSSRGDISSSSVTRRLPPRTTALKFAKRLATGARRSEAKVRSNGRLLSPRNAESKTSPTRAKPSY